VQTEILDMGVLATGRPSTVTLWFPKGQCASSGEKQFCLAEDASVDRVLVLSHGAMGSARGLSWLGEKLASAGYVVLGINHAGESSIYGAEKQDPRSTAVIWQRPQDVSALLDRLTSMPTERIFQRKVNWSNVVAIGHSSGGQTAAMLAGATFDLDRLVGYCASPESKADVSCGYGGNGAAAPDAFKRQFRASQRDTRVKVVVMLDPALGPAVEVESLRKITAPTLVVGAKNNDFLPWAVHGQRYATEIPGAKTHLLNGQEGHFIFITACRHPTKVMGVALCEDRPGVDRAAAQTMVAEVVIRYVRGNS
jgi:predicted dienelactone hydrolase